MKSHKAAALYVVLLTALASAPAAAAEGEGREQSKYRSLVEAGNTALGAKDFAAAYRSFASAYRLAPGAESLFHLGNLAVQEGRQIAAADLLRRYLSDPTLGSGPEALSRQQEAQRLLAQVRAGDATQSGEVSLITDRSAFVLIDDRLLGQLPLSQPLLLPVGLHKLVMEQGSKRQEVDVTVLPGRTIELRYNRASDALILTVPPAALLLTDYQGLPPAGQQRLDAMTAQVLQRERLAPYQKAAALAKFPSFAGCLGQLSCQAELATRAEADYVLSMRIAGSQAAPGGWQIELGLLDPRVPVPCAVARQVCSGCTLEQLVTQTTEALKDLLSRGVGRTQGKVEVRSTPPGAQVRLDGNPLGQTPYEGSLFTGSYTLSLQKDGFAPEQSTLRVESGQTATVEVALRAGQPATSSGTQGGSARARPLWRLVSGGIALSAGALLIGFGAPALALDDRCIDEPVAPKLQCMQRYDTVGIGAGLTGVGSALVLTGVILVALPGPRRAAAPSSSLASEK